MLSSGGGLDCIGDTGRGGTCANEAEDVAEEVAEMGGSVMWPFYTQVS